MAITPKRPSHVIVDVGGTHTRIYLATPSGLRRIASATIAQEYLPIYIRTVLKLKKISADHLTVGLRGVWTAAEKKFWAKKLRPLAKHGSVLSDIELAHMMAFGSGDGIVLNAGTGSIAFGRKGSRTARAGGLGPLLGDEGSAFWIGKQYMKRRYGKTGNLDEIRSLAKSPDVVAKTAALAKKVIQLAKRNADARLVVEAAQESLADLVEEVAEKLGATGSLRLFLTGGLFEDAQFKKGVLKKLKA